MGRALEFGSMLFLGMLLIFAMTHFLNGTLTEWVLSKFYVATPQELKAFKDLQIARERYQQWKKDNPTTNPGGGVNVNPGSNAAGAKNA